MRLGLGLRRQGRRWGVCRVLLRVLLWIHVVGFVAGALGRCSWGSLGSRVFHNLSKLVVFHNFSVHKFFVRNFFVGWLLLNPLGVLVGSHSLCIHCVLDGQVWVWAGRSWRRECAMKRQDCCTLWGW